MRLFPRAARSSSLLPLHFSSGSPERHKGAWLADRGRRTDNIQQHPRLPFLSSLPRIPRSPILSASHIRLRSLVPLLSFCSARNMTSIFKEQSSISPLALAQPISPSLYQPFPHPRFHHRQQQTQRKLNNLSPASSSLQPLEDESTPTASESNTRLSNLP